MNVLLRNLLIAIIRSYQQTLSPDHGWFRHRYPYGFCRFSPSCSQYAVDALLKYGLVKGLLKASWRVVRCNPFHHPAHDPVKSEAPS